MNFAGRLSLGGARRNWGSAYIVSPLAEKRKNGARRRGWTPCIFLSYCGLSPAQGY